MKEYSINKNIRKNIEMWILIISILICLAIQILLNNTLYENCEDNTIILFLSLFIAPSVFSLHLLLKFITFKYLWRIKWINKIIGIPNLNGEWQAIGISDYSEEKTFCGTICIIQTMTKIKIFGNFEYSTSLNTVTYLKIDEDGSFELSYHYDNTPKTKSVNSMQKHCGYMVFSCNKKDYSEFDGEYFNDRFRGTKGEIRLVKQSETKCVEVQE